MIIAMGILNGFNGQMMENTINTSIGHIAIRKSGYGDDMKIEKNFKVSRNIIDGKCRAKYWRKPILHNNSSDALA
jgi:ABC-type lipoprotein release transport system permease subunit